MANQYTNKVVINGITKIDLTGDTITAANLKNGITAHDKSGAPITGTNTFNADTSDTTASADEVLSGETFYGPTGAKVTGSMPNRGAINNKITTKAQVVTVQQGYHDGSGTVQIDATEQAKIIGANIKSGIKILGVDGTYSGEGVSAQAKTATPSFSTQTVLPGAGFDYLSQVTVLPIPVNEADNPQGGVTVTVG